jgi:Lrp/AsnC family transcriptional regulator, leucine-responsive regulatory protein
MTNMQLDDIDYRILAALQDDASLANLELATRVNVSPATTLRRVRVLRESGVIESVVAVVSPAKLGGVQHAICDVTLDVQNAEAFDRFEALVRDVSEVTQCYRTSPGVDFVVFLTLRDVAHYQSLSQTLFTASNNVRNVRTRFVTSRSKFTTRVPLK